jgi:N-acetyltransferase
MNGLDVGTLRGRRVVLEPLQEHHIDEIAEASSGDRSSYRYTQVPEGVEGARIYAIWLMEDAARGRAAPFVQRRVADGEVVGCTRFMHPLHPLGRFHPDEVEIGGTWLNPSAQGTGINIDAKLLMLTHAFDHWHVQRVAICTDARNQQSRRAIERIGAHFEGVIRRHRKSAREVDGDRLRDTAAYSITVQDWPAIQPHLEALADR